jgi:hypothetical protein
VAIFGNLTEFPFPEIVSMLDRRIGVLKFANVKGYEQLELHLNHGQIHGLKVNGAAIEDVFKAKAYLAELFNETQGNFIFEKIRPEFLRHDFSYPIMGMLLHSSAVKDEVAHYRDQLPDIGTRFTIVTQETVWLEENLRDFWMKAQPWLLRGSSAQDIASALNLQMAQVQLLLYKLRLAGLIRPARRIMETTSPQVSAPTAPVSVLAQSTTSSQPKPGLVSRLLSALKLVRSLS